VRDKGEGRGEKRRLLRGNEGRQHRGTVKGKMRRSQDEEGRGVEGVQKGREL